MPGSTTAAQDGLATSTAQPIDNALKNGRRFPIHHTHRCDPEFITFELGGQHVRLLDFDWLSLFGNTLFDAASATVSGLVSPAKMGLCEVPEMIDRLCHLLPGSKATPRIYRYRQRWRGRQWRRASRSAPARCLASPSGEELVERAAAKR